MPDSLTIPRYPSDADEFSPWRRRLRRLLRPALLSMFRTTPISSYWGFDRGHPIDRYYLEQFLDDHRSDIRGRVIEVQNSRYTDRFGGAVERSDVLDINPENPLATVIADLTCADAVPANLFDCFILTQTLQFIFDVPSAIRHVHRMIRPGGVLLASVPSVSRLAPVYGLERDYWRFTRASCAELFGRAFGAGNVSIRSYGNVRTATAFLSGLASEELSRRALDVQDDYFPLIIAIRAVKQ